MPGRPLVVVPIDSSPDGEATVAYAVALATRRGADVDLLHVVRPRGPSVFDSPDLALVGQRSSSSRGREGIPKSSGGEELASTAAGDDVHVRHVSHNGEPAKAIAAYAQLAMASVIVIGKHYGSPRWRRNAAVASSVGRSAPVPVLIVPPPDDGGALLRAEPFTTIVSAVDFTVSSAVALRTALDFARTSGGRVTMVHVLKNASDRMALSGGEAAKAIDEVHAEAANAAARLRREIPATAAGQVDSRVTTGDPARGILHVAAEVHADLIVMGVPPRGRVDEVLFGSTLRGVVRRTTSPVLVLPVVAGAHEWLVGATSSL
jgi:nucleotide-binding universal stress UspA family protein